MIFDVMFCYAAFYGQVNVAHGTFQWQKLEDALKQSGINWGTDVAHNALSDARATLALLGHIADQKTTWEDALDIAERQIAQLETQLMVEEEGDDAHYQDPTLARELNEALEKITYRKVP